MDTSSSSESFLARNEFLIRRLHSLSGLVPVGAYMTVHLLVNSSILASSQKFQELVYQIHSLGPILPLVEWCFIFLPLLFHAIFGVVIVRGGVPNTRNYSTSGNIRYTLQRVSGMIAFFFIFWHVFHMHGWFHTDWWLENVARPMGGAKFAPYNGPSTGAIALQSVIVRVLYAVGMLSCVFHLANGIWTMGITWGVWVSPAAQKRANWVAIAVGVVLSVAGLGSLKGFGSMDEQAIQEAREIEQKMFDAKVAAGQVEADSHKRAGAHGGHDDAEHPAEGEGDSDTDDDTEADADAH